MNYEQAESFDRIVEEYYELYIEEGILKARFKNDAIVDKGISIEIDAKRAAMCKDKRYPCLTDARAVKYWTKDARALMATEHYNRFTKAIAIISNTSIVHATLVNFYLKFDRPKVPTRFFKSYANAIQWLEKYR